MTNCINCGAPIHNFAAVCEFCGASNMKRNDDASDELSRKIQLVDTYIKFEDYKTAIRLCDEICKKIPDQAISWKIKAETYCKALLPSENLIGCLEDSLKKVIALNAFYYAGEIRKLLDSTKEEYKKLIEKQEEERETARIKAEKEAEEERIKKQKMDELKREDEKKYNLKKATGYFLLSILLFVLGAGNCMFVLLWPGALIACVAAIASLCEAYNIIL